jgi:hypothetical protein
MRDCTISAGGHYQELAARLHEVRQISLNIIPAVQESSQRGTYKELLMNMRSTVTCDRKELIYNLIKRFTMEGTFVSQPVGGV